MMKHIQYLAFVAMATIALASCRQEEKPSVTPKPEGPYTYVLAIDGATKAVFEEDHMAWEDGDMIGWFTDKAGSSEVDMNTDPRSFVVSSTAPLAAGSTIYAYAPYQDGELDITAAPFSIPVTQDGSTISSCMPLAAIPVVIGENLAAGDTPIASAQFINLGALVRYNVYSSDTEFAAETVESVAFTANSPIAGDFTMDLTALDINAVEQGTLPDPYAALTESTVISVLSTPAAVGGAKENGVKLYQVIAPGSFSGTITVTTDKAVYTYTLASALDFERGHLQPINLDLGSSKATRISMVEYLLTSRSWKLTGVKEVGNSVTTSVGNILTLNSDGTMAFDCTANNGQTYDHTWVGGLIGPDDYGNVSDMGWSLSNESGTDFITVTDGYLLVFAQSDMTGVYEIKELSETKLTVDIETWGEVWTLQFDAVEDTPTPPTPPTPATTEELLIAHSWVLTGVKEAGNSVTTSVGNILTLSSGGSMSFDCTANNGQTFDHTWVGGLINPDDYDPVSSFSWSVSSEGEKTFLNVEYGYLLVFVQADMNGVYEIKELSETKLTVDVETWGEVWTLLFDAAE